MKCSWGTTILNNRKDSCRIVLVIVVVIVHVSICLYWQSITCCVSCTSYFGFFRTLALFCVNFMGESSWPLLCKVSCTKTYLCIRTNGFYRIQAPEYFVSKVFWNFNTKHVYLNCLGNMGDITSQTLVINRCLLCIKRVNVSNQIRSYGLVVKNLIILFFMELFNV